MSGLKHDFSIENETNLHLASDQANDDECEIDPIDECNECDMCFIGISVDLNALNCTLVLISLFFFLSVA